MTTRGTRVDQPIHQGVEGQPAARLAGGPTADLAFEIIGDPTADGVDIATLFAQVAARMGDHVWMDYTPDGTVCRVRVGRGPVYSGGDRASFALVFDSALLALRLAVDAFQPGSYCLIDDPSCAQPGSRQCNTCSRCGDLIVQSVPLRALADRVARIPRGDRIVALGLLTSMFGYDPSLVRRLLENKLAARGRGVVSAALRLFELGWRDAGARVPDGCRRQVERLQAQLSFGLPEMVMGRPAETGCERAPRSRVRGVEVMSGAEALAFGALTAGLTGCVALSQHPVADRWVRVFASLGGRAFPAGQATWPYGTAPERLLHVEVAGAWPGTGGLRAKGAGAIRAGQDAVQPEPRVILRIERTPPAGEPRFPFDADPLGGAAGCGEGERPVVLAPTTVEECYHFMNLARRLAREYRRDCVVLLDAALLDAVQAWRRHDGEAAGRGWAGWLGEAVADPPAGPSAAAGAVNELLNRLGVQAAPLSACLRAPRPVGGETGDILLVGWGMTRGRVEEAVVRLRAKGLAVSALHLRVLSPLPDDLGSVLARFQRVVIVDVADDARAAARRTRSLANLLWAAMGRGPSAASRPALAVHLFSRPVAMGPGAVEEWAAAWPAAAHHPDAYMTTRR